MLVDRGRKRGEVGVLRKAGLFVGDKAGDRDVAGLLGLSRFG